MSREITVKENTREKLWIGDKRYRRVTLEVLIPETEMVLSDVLTENKALSSLGETLKEAASDCTRAYLDFAAKYIAEGEETLRLLSLPEEEFQAEMNRLEQK